MNIIKKLNCDIIVIGASVLMGVWKGWEAGVIMMAAYIIICYLSNFLRR